MFSFQTRVDHLAKMAQTQLDILIIGGGINGAGIALDGITRGLGVGVVEMGDFSSGTSSRSTKLIHGGLRYLKQGQVKTVQEVGFERHRLYENAPHLAKPFKIMLPFYQGGSFSKWSAAAGLTLYDRLARVKASERKVILNTGESLKREPALKAPALTGSGVYVEYRTDDSRLTLEVLKRAAEFGAYIANYTKVEKLLYHSETRKVIGVRVRDLVTNKESAIYARRVINAAGPWVDKIQQLDDSQHASDLLLTKGVHVVLDRKRLPLTNSLYFDTPFADGRMLFAILRDNKVYVGTTDTFYHGDPTQVIAEKEDVTYILEALNLSFNIEPLTLADVEVAWAGLRPLIKESGKAPSEISRKDEIFKSASGLYSIAGGKLTGYRIMSKKVIDTVLRDLCRETGRLFIKCRTENLALSGGNVGGGTGFPRYVNEFVKIGTEKFHLAHRHASYLVNRYGSNVIDLYAYLLNLPSHSQLGEIDYIMLRYALEHEMSLHPLDFLVRRSSLAFFDYHHAQKIKAGVIDEMAKFYLWSPARIDKLTAETDAELNKLIHFKA